MSCGNSVDNNFGFLVYTVTARTGNNTSYSVIVDSGTEKDSKSTDSVPIERRYNNEIK